MDATAPIGLTFGTELFLDFIVTSMTLAFFGIITPIGGSVSIGAYPNWLSPPCMSADTLFSKSSTLRNPAIQNF